MYHILIVDDEPSIRKGLSMGLTSEDFEVTAASDGLTGILFGKKKTYDILIVDLCLPDMTGLDVIRALKEHTPELITIVITGNGSMESTIESIQLEVSDYIEKPIKLETLRNTIYGKLRARDEKRRILKDKLRNVLELYSPRKTCTVLAEASMQMLAHQICNPLMVINGSAQLAMFKLKDDETLRKYIAKIIAASDKIAEINKKVMISSNMEETENEILIFHTILDDVLLRFEALMNLYEIKLVTDYDATNVNVWGRRDSFQQILCNIILNAIESMQNRPLRILTIHSDIDYDGLSMKIVFEYTGCGIDEENLSSICHPHYSSKSYGLELGLYIAQKLAQKMGCKITSESQIDKGRRFILNIPISDNGAKRNIKSTMALKA